VTAGVVFAEYAAAGWALCALQPGTKKPAGKKWTTTGAIRNPVQAARLAAAGLVHEQSGTCAVDFDDLAGARTWLAAQGIDADALLSHEQAVHIDSGRENRAKLLFCAPKGCPPLRTHKVCGEGGAVLLELRHAGAQDVLPPSMHPSTGKPYAWRYGEPLAGSWSCLPDLPPGLLALWQSLDSGSAVDATSPPVPTGASIDTLRLHLATVRKSAKDNRDDWVRVGMALHHETDGTDDGCELWRDWSAPSHKYDDADLTRVWESFGKGTDRALVTLKTLRDMHDPSDPACEAARHALITAEFDDVTAQVANVATHPWARFIDLAGAPSAPRFVIPGFIQEGTVLVSGAPGAGKTTALVPLALIAAGLHREGEPLAPKHWRHVCYITEDEAQVQRIIHALAGCPEWRASLGMIKDRLHVAVAQRLKPAEAVRAGRVFREQFTRVVNGTEVLPLVVVDTTAAALALENENDNSEVSAAVAAFKQGFAGLPTWLVGHTAKASWGQADTAAMSARGGGAWGADAHQQLFMIVEGGRRYLRLGKTRFEARWPELEIGSRAVVMPVVDPFGEADSMMVRWGEPSPGDLVKGAADRSDDDTRALLRLLADAEAAGNPIPTAEAGAHTASCILRGQAGYPAHRKPAEILHLLRAAETAGLLARADHRGADRHWRGRWSVTEAGHAVINGV